MFTDIVWNIFYKNDRYFVLSKINIDEQLDLCRKESEVLKRKIDELSEGIIQINDIVSTQKKVIKVLEDNIKKETEFEAYWNNKYTSGCIVYKGRSLPFSNVNKP